MNKKISGDVLALFPPSLSLSLSLSSKYYWRQFASQYLTKLIRCAVASVGKGVGAGGASLPPSLRPSAGYFAQEGGQKVFISTPPSVGRDGSVHIANKN